MMWALVLVSALEVEADVPACPNLAKTIAAASSADGRLEIRDVAGGLQVELFALDGSRLGRRRVHRPPTCSGRADAALALVDAWNLDVFRLPAAAFVRKDQPRPAVNAKRVAKRPVVRKEAPPKVVDTSSVSAPQPKVVERAPSPPEPGSRPKLRAEIRALVMGVPPPPDAVEPTPLPPLMSLAPPRASASRMIPRVEAQAEPLRINWGLGAAGLAVVGTTVALNVLVENDDNIGSPTAFVPLIMYSVGMALLTGSLVQL